MSYEILTLLLKEYEQKKIKAELDLERRKNNLYDKLPELEQIESKINSCAINKAKCILLNNSSSLKDIDEKISLFTEEKKNILRENDINEDFFIPRYECKICSDTGYILSDKGSKMCNCMKQKILNLSYNKANISSVKKENFDTFDENYFSDEINSKFKISAKSNIKNIKNKCLDFIDNFNDPNTRNLFFTGNTGLGKTFMSNCIAEKLISKGKTVIYQTAPVLLDTIIDAKMSKTKTPQQINFIKDILEADFLIIDDLGTECMNSMKITELFNIINTRLLNLDSKTTKTLISTNLSLEQVFRVYEERIGSRIAGFYDIYYFFGDDLRLKKYIRN